MREDATATGKVDNQGRAAPARPVQVELPKAVLLNETHRTDAFRCAKSARVQGFFAREAPLLTQRGYCRAFVLPDPKDATRLLGYYTLSAASLEKERLSRSDEGRSPFGFDAPMARIGFMGRDDNSPKTLGSALLTDAARRVYHSDIGACGIVLEPEGGPANKKLWEWYLSQKFKACRIKDGPGSMYAPLSVFLPELQPSKSA